MIQPVVQSSSPEVASARHCPAVDELQMVTECPCLIASERASAKSLSIVAMAAATARRACMA